MFRSIKVCGQALTENSLIAYPAFKVGFIRHCLYLLFKILCASMDTVIEHHPMFVLIRLKASATWSDLLLILCTQLKLIM